MVENHELEIRELKQKDEIAFLKAYSEWDHANGFEFAGRFNPDLPFIEYVKMRENEKLGINLRSNYVPNSYYFGFLGDVIVGRVSIRHKLNDVLIKSGGHIGYCVMPDYRSRGLATKLLQFAIVEAKKLNINSILVTCDEENIASSKVIEKCGGKLENILSMPDENKRKKRYWIN